jgi:rubredoxin
MRRWMCVLCGFVYDERLGLPAEGIAAGTPWADVPDTWRCRDCGTGKADFEMADIGPSERAASASSDIGSALADLSR